MESTTKMYPLIAMVIAVAALTGCESTTPRLDASFGESVTLASAAQVLRPSQAADRDPVTGIDGMAAAAAMTRYFKSFATPPPPVHRVG